MASQKILPNLFQTAAQYRVYTRLLSLSLSSIGTIVLGPVAAKILGFFVNLITNDMCCFTLMLTVGLVMGAYLLAFRLSSSPKALDMWLAKSEGTVPLYSFLISCFVARSISTMSGVQGMWDPSKLLPTFGGSIRIALAVILLQAIIAMRYISPVSISKSASHTKYLI